MSVANAETLSDSKNTSNPDRVKNILKQAAELDQSGASLEEVISFKESQGLQVLDVSEVYVDLYGNEINPNGIGTLALDAAYRKITNTMDYDPQTGEYNIYGKIEHIADLGQGWMHEPHPASYDVVSADWNSDLLQYRSWGLLSGSSSNFWLNDATQREKGSLLFNLKDNFPGGTSIHFYVELRKAGSKTGTTSTQIRYTHTYDKTAKTTTYSGNASYQWGNPGPSFGVTYTVLTTQVEANWSRSGTTSFSVR